MSPESPYCNHTKLTPSRYLCKPKTLPLLLVLALFTVLVRGMALLAVPGSFQEDRDLYRQLAENLLREGRFALGGKPTAFRPPAYPILLVPCVAAGPYTWWAIATLHLALGVATVLLTVFLAKKIAGLRAGLLAGMLLAADPLLVWQSTQIMSETAAVFFVVVTLFCGLQASKPRNLAWSFLTGTAAGITALTRANLLPWTLLVPGLLGLVRQLGENDTFTRDKKREESTQHSEHTKGSFQAVLRLSGSKVRFREVIKTSLIGYVGLGSVLFPWVLRNRLVLGHWIIGTTHGGITFFLANNDYFYDHLKEGRAPRTWRSEAFLEAWEQQVKQYPGLDEAQRDGLAYTLAKETLARRPKEFWISCFWRILWLWTPFPPSELSEAVIGGILPVWLVGGFYVFQYVCAIWGFGIILANRKNSGESWFVLLSGVALALVLTAVHAFYWSNMRMRAPVIPLIASFAGIPISGPAFWRPIDGNRI